MITIKQIEVNRDIFGEGARGWIRDDQNVEYVLNRKLVDTLFKNPANEKHFRILLKCYNLLPER